jgi:hypothetical protein
VLWPYASDTRSRREPVRIDRWLPSGARKLERHVIDVPADLRTALAAIANLRLGDIPVVRSLFAIRGIPYQAETTLCEFFGTSPFLILDEDPGREVVFGVLGPFWQFRPEHLPHHVARTPQEFRESLARNRMAAIGNFRVDPGASASRLWTETWVFAPGAGQAILFATYWMVVGPFSAWIRRMMLRAASRCARGASAV